MYFAGYHVHTQWSFRTILAEITFESASTC